jgi:hypothetical protein
MSLFRKQKYFIKSSLLALFLLTAANSVQSQSLDARSPSPVRGNEVVGRISARDLGDARLTDHFYTFTGTPGDLLITIDTRNLNGDIDVFIAGSLRPVLKLAVYAEATSPVTKSIYLRQREEFILRVEARSPNDDDGIYHLRFGGAFEPIIGAAETTEEAAGETAANQPVRRGKRVSSVGARINEPTPPPEVAAAVAPTPEPTPTVVETPSTEPKLEAPPEASPKPARNARSRPTPPRRGRGRGTATAAKPATEVAASKSDEENSGAEPTTTKPDESAAARKNSKKSRTEPTEVEVSDAATSDSSPPSKARSSKGSESGAAQPEENRSKLIIEMLDGTRVEHYMSSVRRVTVESGQIIVTRTDGEVERIRLASVIRMSIGP